MNLRTITVATLATLLTVIGAISIGHDKVQPFPQPEPVTVSEKTAIKFKPQLNINFGCGVYPAVNAAGKTNGGLKGTGGVSGYSYLYPTTGAGDFHDLIMWDQLTDAARAALNTTDFGSAKVPFSDDNFSEKLKNAWPF
ncbi:hypothetical protein BBJ29_006252 [Phytophthora kernoviae]|uniref:Uncharacterized protein n=1 Tax=Phytophthora kernoviae TaxID=325452 RepID=A0A3F2RGP1_9STRA|nr:hypothetical protein BBJ29_006252 [Phytophthora kernoviae]RLN56416.1 hypothetical protein BBP00_00008022 [Phytophthora kernoviae]